MKLNKGKNKGKVHPSPSSSSSSPSSFSLSSSSNSTDPISALNILLPAAILTLISALSLPDREVFAYMISRSLKFPPSFIPPPITTKRKSKNSSSSSSSSSCCLSSSGQHRTQKSPAFDCDCFDCYTAYWVRWDSSPHRELIHQAIEAFEEHLASSELLLPKKKERSRSRKDKDPKSRLITEEQKVIIEEKEEKSPVNGESLPEEVATAVSDVKEVDESGGQEEVGEEEEEEQQQKQQVQQQHKGLARKVLPDVIGLFNSRLWNLWGPNV